VDLAHDGGRLLAPDEDVQALPEAPEKGVDLVLRDLGALDDDLPF